LSNYVKQEKNRKPKKKTKPHCGSGDQVLKEEPGTNGKREETRKDVHSSREDVEGGAGDDHRQEKKTDSSTGSNEGGEKKKNPPPGGSPPTSAIGRPGRRSGLEKREE